MSEKTKSKTGTFFEFSLALSAASLGLALSTSNGFLSGDVRDPISMTLLSASLLACIASLLFSRCNLPNLSHVPLVRIVAKEPVFALLFGALWLQLAVLMWRYNDFLPLFAMALVLSCFAFAALPQGELRWTRRKAIPAGVLWLLFVFCGGCVLFYIRYEISDVIVVQRDASRALLQGRNPYTLTFPNIYDALQSRNYYGDGTVVNGRVKYGFPYPPLTLFWVLPAQAWLGDFRYGHLLALALSAFLIAALRPARVTMAAAALLIYSTSAFFVLQVGWTEPVAVMIFCAIVWLAKRGSRGTGAAFGLLAIAKQYFVLMLPLMFFLPLPHGASTRARWKESLFAIATAILVMLPFAWWNARAFFDSLVTLQLHQPFRINALNYTAFIKLMGGPQLPSFFGFVAAALAFAFCLRRAPRTVAGFAASTALVYLSFFAFGKQAFANYYFFVFAALCSATAAAHCENNS